jgi:hypothetical protein
MTTDKATGREIGSTIGDPIPTASCVKLSDILLLSAPNFSNVVMVSSIVPIWHCTILQVLLNGFQTPVQINTSHLTLQPWLLHNHTMVMIICMLVMVRDFPYLISVIPNYIPHTDLSLYLMSCIFLQSWNLCFLFRNFVLIIMFILNFTLFCFMSRISTPMKYSSQDRVKMVSILFPGSGLQSCQFLKPIGLFAFLLLLICGIVA